jgi:hypothetical protein
MPSVQCAAAQGYEGRSNRETRTAYQNLLRRIPALHGLQSDLLAWVTLLETPKTPRKNPRELQVTSCSREAMTFLSPPDDIILSGAKNLQYPSEMICQQQSSELFRFAQHDSACIIAHSWN